ncbi:MAG TPA: transcription antitermination factor NusB [Candidatus Dormibacteraeota bacterium]|nr:transcription antitermination factor NusB [Candidatus Dormibacteraeota bacterium]
MGRRHQARELALKVLFELESDPKDAADVLRYRAGEEAADPDIERFATNLVAGVEQHREKLDELIASASQNWRLDQMAKVDRIILRIAAYEIAVAHDVPVRAAINESIELAKTFSGDEAGRFVNGVLGKIASTEAANG